MDRTAAFVAFSRLSAKLPPFKGRTRLFLMLYDHLGLKSKHLQVRTTLRDPIQYEASLDLHSWLQRIAYLTGGYEAETTRFLVRLQKCMGGNGYLLDVGANVGLISIPFAKLKASEGMAEPVVAVEAVSANVAALHENIRLSSAENLVKVLPFALGEREKSVDIQVEGDLAEGQGSGTANILAEGSDYQCVRIKLDVRMLDSLMDSGALPQNCGVIKIDTDGYDLKVLEGGARFLARYRPVVFGEFSAHCMRWHGQSIGDVDVLAKQLDYVVWPRSGNALRFTRDWDPDRYEQDILMVPREREGEFRWCLDMA